MRYVSKIEEISITENAAWVSIKDPAKDSRLKKKNLTEIKVYFRSGHRIQYGIFNVDYDEVVKYFDTKSSLLTKYWDDEADAYEYVNVNNIKIKIDGDKIKLYTKEHVKDHYLEYLARFTNTAANKELFKDAELAKDDEIA